ncbi:MAG: EAL domain-containing protein [Actinomycetota bacterium]
MTRGWVEDRSLPVAVLRHLQGLGLDIAYQPITDLGSGRVVGVESLARFSGEPPVSPDIWFRRAEEVGLRSELEEKAISIALERLAEVPNNAYVTVNCSPAVACSGALDRLLAGRPLDRIIVEITEGERIAEYAALNGALADLRARGLRIAIDDAGAGFAGMAHMVELRPDIIKLDIELTRNIDTDKHRRALVRSLVAYAGAVGAAIIAEGIETDRELRALQGLGVHFGQGYLLGRPGQLPAGFRKVHLPSHHLRRLPRPRVGRMLAAVAVALMLAVPTAALADNAQPGNPLWSAKLKLETLRVLLAGNEYQRVSLHLEFAARRADELNALLEKPGGVGHAIAVIANLDENTRDALVEAGDLARRGGPAGIESTVRDAVLRRVASANRALAGACSVHSNGTCAAARKTLDGLTIVAAPHAPSKPPVAAAAAARTTTHAAASNVPAAKKSGTASKASPKPNATHGKPAQPANGKKSH